MVDASGASGAAATPGTAPSPAAAGDEPGAGVAAPLAAGAAEADALADGEAEAAGEAAGDAAGYTHPIRTVPPLCGDSHPIFRCGIDRMMGYSGRVWKSLEEFGRWIGTILA